MANLPPGWTKSVEDDSVYVASVRIKDKVDTRTNVKYTIKVNNETGIIDLYYPTPGGDKLFHRYDPTLDKWIIPPGTDYDASEFYIRALKSAGSDDFQKLKETAKSGAVKIINDTSSDEAKQDISDKDGYKSSIDNTSGGDGKSPSEGSAPPIDKETLEAIKDVDFAKDNYRTTYSKDLRYPKYLKLTRDSGKPNETLPDVIEFTMVAYGNRVPKKESFGFEERSFGNPIGKVTLAIPAGISDTNSVNWSDENFGPLEQGAVDIANALIEEGGEGIDKIINKAKVAAGNTQLQQALITLAKQEAAGTKGLLSRLNGAVFNPNIELLFTGPLLREFSYVIDMAPRDQPEAAEIKKIIRFFKQGMSVKRSTDALFLKAPHVFNIKYLFSDSDPTKNPTKDHPFINMIKGPCALTNLSVDYTPQGTYMTHRDGSMISYRMNMTFKELEPVFDDDYKNVPGDVNDTHIGY